MQRWNSCGWFFMGLSLGLLKLACALDPSWPFEAGVRKLAEQLIQGVAEKNALPKARLLVSDFPAIAVQRYRRDQERVVTGFSTYIAIRLQLELQQTHRFGQFVEQRHESVLLKEQGRQMAPQFDEHASIQAGRMLGATHIVLGDYVSQDLSPRIEVQAYLVDVETGIRLASARVAIEKTSDLIPLLEIPRVVAVHKTILVLNQWQISLAKMALTRDRHIVDCEYLSFLKRLDTNKIGTREVVNKWEELSKALAPLLLSDTERQAIRGAYDHALEESLQRTLPRFLPSPIPGALNLDKRLCAIQNLGILYFHCTNRPDAYRKAITGLIKKVTLGFLGDRAKLSSSELALVAKLRANVTAYLRNEKRFKDKSRLLDVDVQAYLEALKDDRIDSRFRRLNALKDRFEAYPPFWYHLGRTAQDLHNKEQALRCYEAFEKHWKPVFRSDPFYISLCMDRAALRSPEAETDGIKHDLETLGGLAASSNPEAKIFAGLSYLKLGMWDKAKSLFEENLDDRFLPWLNRRFLGETRVAAADDANEESLRVIQNMCSTPGVTIQEAMYFLGDPPDLTRLNKLARYFVPARAGGSRKGWAGFAQQAEFSVIIPKSWGLKGLRARATTSNKSKPAKSLAIVKDQIAPGTWCACTFPFHWTDIGTTIRVDFTYPLTSFALVFRSKPYKKTVAVTTGWFPQKIEQRIKFETRFILVEVVVGKTTFPVVHGKIVAPE